MSFEQSIRDWASNPANWPKGPLVGKSVRILSGIHAGEVHEVVSDMNPRLPVIGVLLPGSSTPAAYLSGEYVEVNDD